MGCRGGIIVAAPTRFGSLTVLMSKRYRGKACVYCAEPGISDSADHVLAFHHFGVIIPKDHFIGAGTLARVGEQAMEGLLPSTPRQGLPLPLAKACSIMRVFKGQMIRPYSDCRCAHDLWLLFARQSELHQIGTLTAIAIITHTLLITAREALAAGSKLAGNLWSCLTKV